MLLETCEDGVYKAPLKLQYPAHISELALVSLVFVRRCEIFNLFQGLW